ILNVLFFDLPVSDIPNYRERVLSVTPEDIQRVARKYVQPDRLSIVLVGNARAFASQLVEMGMGGYEVIPVDQLDLMAPNLKRDKRRVSFEPFGSFGSLTPFDSFQSHPAYSQQNANGSNVPNAPNVQNDSNVPNGSNDPNVLIQRVVAAKGGLAA